MGTTVILGAGFGGIACATSLKASLPKEKIVLIDANERFTVGAGLTWVMLGARTPEQISRPLALLKQRDLEVQLGEVESIDPATRTVTWAGGKLKADNLVVALGVKLDLGAVLGLAEAAKTFFTLDGAKELAGLLPKFDRGEVVVLIPRAPFKCPPAPYEAAMLLADHFRRRKAEVKVSVHTVEPAPMATAGPEIGKNMIGLLDQAGVAHHFGRKAVSVDAKAKQISFEGGATARFDLLIAVPPHGALAVVKAAGLAAESGFIPVEPTTLKTKFDRVWAIGDVTSVPLPGRFKPDVPLSLPKAGVFAESQGRAVAAQIAGNPKPFDGAGFCYVETGDQHAMRGDGKFFELPHPVMTPSGEPNLDGYRAKLAWVDGWLEQHFG